MGFLLLVRNRKLVFEIETQTVISKAIEGKALLGGILLSQILSNVSAAIMLSGFVTDAKALLLGVKFGYDGSNYATY